MPRLCFALDLKDDPALIAAYDAYHRQVWPEILASIRASGILEMEIYRTGNRLFMMMETSDSFDPDEKRRKDSADSKVMEWEELMWKYQQAIPGAAPDEKWVRMDRIFKL